MQLTGLRQTSALKVHSCTWSRYGPSSSAEEYVVKSQVSALESHRAMFEAFGRNKYVATGVIQWMLVNAWPSHMWHLMDYCELCVLDLSVSVFGV